MSRAPGQATVGQVSTDPPSTRDIVGALADPDRLRVVAAVALGAGTMSDVVAATGLTQSAVATAARRLVRSGVVVEQESGWHVDEARLQEAVRAETPPRVPEDFGITDRHRLAVLRAFFRNGQLQSLPAAAGKRAVVLDHIATLFEPGHRYAEREVDAILRSVHPDYAMLRRYLVEALLLTRDHGVYWRTGGWVDVTDTQKPPTEPA
jgi:hypothetical protein